MENGNFCKGCQSEADKNASGFPNCGTVTQRLNAGLMEFRDPKGRSPTAYLGVLEKLKIPLEVAEEEAGKIGHSLDEIHLAVPEKKTKSKKSVENADEKKRGRPKKTPILIESEEKVDLFAMLQVEEAVVEELSGDSSSDESASTSVKKVKKLKLSAEEKEAKKAAEAQAKLEREAMRKEELEAKKLKKAEEQEAKKAKKAEEQEAKKAKKAEEKAGKVQEKKEPVKKEETPAAQVTQKVTVSRITINDKQYLKSSTGILYDPSSKEEVGIYDEENKTILPLPDDEEEEEEDYDEED